ncbi:MAG: septum formation initiator family protein [Bacteroidales bacterium]|jgi:cell division protein FtsB|nr:septum formation initiator family protein [Bacteroidales bacterium]
MKINKERIVKLLKNTLFWVIVVFLFLLLFGTHSVIKLYNYEAELRSLEQKQKMLEEKISNDSINTLKMQKDIKFIERYAREKYMMKKDNEDLYIIKETK